MADLAEIDRQLDALGAVPGNIEELVARYGEADLSAQRIDGLLDDLAAGVKVALPSPAPARAPGAPGMPARSRTGRVAPPVAPAPKAPAPAPISPPAAAVPSPPAAPFNPSPMPAAQPSPFPVRGAEPVALPSLTAPAVPKLVDEDERMEIATSAPSAVGPDAGDAGADDGGLAGLLEPSIIPSELPEAEEVGDDEATLAAAPEPDDPEATLQMTADTLADDVTTAVDQLLEQDLDPSDFPQTPAADPPEPMAAAGDRDGDEDAGGAGDSELEILVDEDDIIEIDEDFDDFELLEDD
ncbi:MAG: hypothetical protein OEZ06_31070 [Myxococcales bacterium]|nr:hypothetical protein [Myxococcales bacterium]